MIIKNLTKCSKSLYAWRNLELSHICPYRWVLAFNGSDKRLPCGCDSRLFVNLSDAVRYLTQYGYTLETSRTLSSTIANDIG